jgi:6-pyruvoyltetrahydropterin/6-carboxytetrahydropterin synthase
MPHYELTVRAQAECALSITGASHPDAGVHGRTYLISACFTGAKLDALGFLADERELRALLVNVVAELDHKYLNELPQFEGVNPSAERIARWVAEMLLARLPEKCSARLAWVDVIIHRDASARYVL